jgi:hypothetical protein
MGNGESEGKETGAGRYGEKDLDARLRELEEFLNGEFHERIRDFWLRALKLYIDNVLDVFSLEDQFGELREAGGGSPSFYTELRYRHQLKDGIDEFADKIQEKRGIYPVSLSYYGVFAMRFFNGVCIDFYDAWVLEVGDAERKKTGFVVLDFREARVLKFPTE